MTDISDSKILIMATNRFEESELFGPLERLREKGAEVKLASIDTDEIQGTVHDKPGKSIKPDMTIDEARESDFDALMLPGGVGNPDRLRMEDKAIALVRAFVDAGKPVAAICHGPWLLAEADVIKDKTVTSWPSIRTDLKNAGADVVDKEAVTDGNIITSRNPDDVPAFTDALISAIEA